MFGGIKFGNESISSVRRERTSVVNVSHISRNETKVKTGNIFKPNVLLAVLGILWAACLCESTSRKKYGRLFWLFHLYSSKIARLIGRECTIHRKTG